MKTGPSLFIATGAMMASGNFRIVRCANVSGEMPDRYISSNRQSSEYHPGAENIKVGENINLEPSDP